MRDASYRSKNYNISYNLDDVMQILRASNNKKLDNIKKVKSSFVDNFLYSGRFNSVLGLDGFQYFKDKLKEVIKKVNDDDFKSNYINLDEMYQVLLASGVYYVEEYLPTELDILKKDERWLTAYRYISKNFPEISYKDFREIVKRFQETEGHSFYISEKDSVELQEMSAQSNLFKVTKDAKASLLQLTMKDLKVICEKLGISAARSIEETSERILESAKERVFDYLPEHSTGRKTLFIKDEELASGEDLIHLDSYLRIIAKVVREDLAKFIETQRSGLLVA